MIWTIIFSVLSFMIGMMIGLHPRVHLLHQQVTDKLGSRYGGK